MKTPNDELAELAMELAVTKIALAVGARQARGEVLADDVIEFFATLAGVFANEAKAIATALTEMEKNRERKPDEQVSIRLGYLKSRCWAFSRNINTNGHCSAL